MPINRLGKGWDKLGLRSTGMHILLSFSDGKGALLQSPKGKTIRIGLKARFGWMIVLLGCWIMFGDHKKWTTATGRMKQKTGDEMVGGFN